MQEERQRGKDRNESEVESTSSANEDMPVEKILEAELAVEPKTETYVEANMGLNPSSVSVGCPPASVSPVLTLLPFCSNSQRFEPFGCCGLCPYGGTSVPLGDPVSGGYTSFPAGLACLPHLNTQQGRGQAQLSVGSWLTCRVRLGHGAGESSREAVRS